VRGHAKGVRDDSVAHVAAGEAPTGCRRAILSTAVPTVSSRPTPLPGCECAGMERSVRSVPLIVGPELGLEIADAIDRAISRAIVLPRALRRGLRLGGAPRASAAPPIDLAAGTVAVETGG